MYDDYLLVDEAEPLLDYILSCHGNQSEILSQRQLEFKQFLQKKIREKGGIRITKMAGVFLCSGICGENSPKGSEKPLDSDAT